MAKKTPFEKHCEQKGWNISRYFYVKINGREQRVHLHDDWGSDTLIDVEWGASDEPTSVQTVKIADLYK